MKAVESHWLELPQVPYIPQNIFEKFCHDKHTSVVTKDAFCHDKHVFVQTKVSLWRQNICRDKITTKICLSGEKNCLDKHVFVAIKMIRMAAPATILEPCRKRQVLVAASQEEVAQ